MRRDRQHSGRIVTLIPYFRCVPDYPTPVGNARTTCHRRIATSRTLPDKPSVLFENEAFMGPAAESMLSAYDRSRPRL